MAKLSVFDWDSTAANNTDIASIPIDGAVTTPSQVDNIIREEMAQVGEFVDDLGGVNTVAGTANAITITAKSAYSAYATGLVVAFKAGASNTGATTVDVNGIGAKAIRKFSGGAEAALEAGDIIIGQTYLMVYDTAANSAAGAWKLLSPSGGGNSLSLTSTDSGVNGSPTINLIRNSASPAVDDALGLYAWTGKDSGGNDYIYASYYASIISPTNGSEQGQLNWTVGNGASSATMSFGPTTGLLVVGNIETSNSINANGALTTTIWANHKCKAGTSGAYIANNFNILYSGGLAYLYIDNTNLGTFTYASDYRIKKAVTDLPSTWDAVKNLRPVKYTGANFGDLFVSDEIEKWSFIAHEVQETLVPSAATSEKDAEDAVQSLNLAAILSALTKAFQEAQLRIEAQDARIAALEAGAS